jgi:hypothetical protein
MKKRYYGTFFLSLIVAGGFMLAYSVSLGARRPAAAQTPKPAPAAYEKLLTVADVESATGIKGLKLVPRDPRNGAGGNLNFAQADGSLLLMVTFGDAGLFNAWKAQEGIVNSAVNGVGDEAFNGPKVAAPYVLFFRKGNHAASLSSFLNVDTMKPFLSQDQLRAMAKIIVSRL